MTDFINNPPKNVYCELKSNLFIDEEDLQKFLWENFHIDLELDEDSNYRYDLFYNSDLRSFMGYMKDLGCFHIITTYYIPGWEDLWKKLVDSCEVIRSDCRHRENQ